MIFSLNSYSADESIDFSNAKVELFQENSVGYWEYYIKVTGLTLNKDNIYKIYIKSGDAQLDLTKDTEDVLLTEVGKKIKISVLNELYTYNEDIYCYIVEQLSDGKYGTPYKTKLERLPQHNLGKRINIYFSATDTSVFCYEDFSNKNRKLKVKIGTITDKNILLSIKNGETNSLQKLLNYAKSAKSIYTGTIPIGDSNSITSSLNIKNNEYYYVYMEMDDENGKYYPIEDVSLYQALIGNEIGKNLYNYLDENFKWNLDDGGSSNKPILNNTKTPDNTLANGKIPKAGIGFGIIILIIITVDVLVFTYYKYNKLKGI